jgi:hypothetical protein
MTEQERKSGRKQRAKGILISLTAIILLILFIDFMAHTETQYNEKLEPHCEQLCRHFNCTSFVPYSMNQIPYAEPPQKTDECILYFCFNITDCWSLRFYSATPDLTMDVKK